MAVKTALVVCPKHEGAFDCSPFCGLCEGEQEYWLTADVDWEGWASYREVSPCSCELLDEPDLEAGYSCYSCYEARRYGGSGGSAS